MGINQIILYIMIFFMVLGAGDKIIGNRFGIGKKFDDGILSMGPLAIVIVGVFCLAPVLAVVLKPIVIPVYTFLGADPAMFATTLLACDMGGYNLAQELALTPEAADFAGIILGTMMGPTVVFSIPVALGIIKQEDHKPFAMGILSGIVTVPIGCFVGGLVAGFDVKMIVMNLIPIMIVAVLVSVGLWRIPGAMIKGFNAFGKIVMVIITAALAVSILQALTGVVLIAGMAPIDEGLIIVGHIAIVLAGAFPMVYVMTKAFKKPLIKVGVLLGINEIAAAGLVASLASNIPMFEMMKDMDQRGKVLNVAFCVSGAFVFGGHLGFTAGVSKDMIFPMIVGKLVGGITAVCLAFFFVREKVGGQVE